MSRGAPALVHAPTAPSHVRPRLPDVAKQRTPAFPQRRPCLVDATNKFRVMLQTIIEPIVFGRKPDQDACGTTMASDHDLFVHCQAKIFGEIILDFRQGHRSWPSLRPESLARRAIFALRLS